MKYERLTERICGAVTIKGEYGDTISFFDRESNRVIDRLAELEDKIEQGTLIELPCKVGDTLYIVGFTSNKYGIFRGVQSVEIGNIAVNQEGEFLTDIGEYTTDLRIIGKSIYLTREEAEKRLRELQGDKE